MQSRPRSYRFAAALGLLALMLVLPMVALAQAPANQYFERTWQRTDQQVASGDATRTWIWGPSGFTGSCYEPYYKLTAGEREVQYFDKSRMEINDPLGNTDSEWYVTQGLLATEMITGNMQVGDNEYIDWGPAEVHVAGNAGGGSPNYSAFGPLMYEPALDSGQTITQTLDSEGNAGDNPALADYGVTAEYYVSETGNQVASVFWEFMNSSGPIFENGVNTSGNLFANPFYAAGLPITEAYWTNVIVGEDPEPQDVLVQAFERRVLTYTPGNDEGWQVEAGNVGQHYYMWRYGAIPDDSANACPNTMYVTFQVYEPDGAGDWNRVALTTTSEVWHPDGVATGTWSAYVDDGGDGDVLPRNSSGILKADHEYTTEGGIRLLSSMTANITQVDGPTGGTAQVQAGGFAPGPDPRVPGSIFTGSGSIAYDTGTVSDTMNFDVVGISSNVFRIYLDGEAPPVFFQ